MQETLNQILSWLSLFVGVAALVMSFYTIWLARQTERETRESFQRSEDRIREHYEKLKEVLAAIETRSATTEQSVRLSQDHLLTTITNLVNETLIPKKVDMGEQMGMQFMQSLFNDTDGGMKKVESLAGLMKIVGQSKD
ncbi:hypothetical protein CSQ91_05630 [Janthinobacterium sp. BJB301]|uniref:hypothetical protein n=1 Tax=Janthinobacterium sp. BJB301 TaxID=1560195 RepID=UPI000C113121|nr:hypothetical protein [Janthinobacterium sp. BJB301]PHV50648.1 hypothetical protein CSQ91_05630 [Janthinobacterium sp. BJB301]